MEQRISANEIRSKQAFQAAQAGVDRAMAYMQKGGIDRNNNNKADTNDDDNIVSLVETLDGETKYRFKYCAPDSLPDEDPPCPDTPGMPDCDGLPNDPDKKDEDELGKPTILSCGWSDDNLAKRAIVVTSKLASFLSDAPDNPLMSKGTLNVSGSATVINYYTNLTIWTGGAFTGIGNSGKTFIRNPKVAPPGIGGELPDDPPPSSCSTDDNYTCLTDKSTKGPDIIENDLSLRNLTADEMFMSFFGVDFGTYKSGIATRTISSGEVSSIVGAVDEAIVITGNTRLPNGTIGTREQPVVVIIDGNWEGGNVTLHGILYVRGNADVAGNPEIIGAVTVAGTMSGTGSLDVFFDPLALENAHALGKAGVISGSWRDWL